MSLRSFIQILVFGKVMKPYHKTIIFTEVLQTIVSVTSCLWLPFLPSACQLCFRPSSHSGHFVFSSWIQLHYHSLFFSDFFFSYFNCIFKHIGFAVGNYELLLYHILNLLTVPSPRILNTELPFFLLFLFLISVLSHSHIPGYLSKHHPFLAMLTAIFLF